MISTLIKLISERTRKSIDTVNTKFGRLPEFWKRFILITVGLAAAAVCLSILIEAVTNYPNNTIMIDRITTPSVTT